MVIDDDRSEDARMGCTDHGTGYFEAQRLHAIKSLDGSPALVGHVRFSCIAGFVPHLLWKTIRSIFCSGVLYNPPITFQIRTNRLHRHYLARCIPTTHVWLPLPSDRTEYACYGLEIGKIAEWAIIHSYRRTDTHPIHVRYPLRYLIWYAPRQCLSCQIDHTFFPPLPTLLAKASPLFQPTEPLASFVHFLPDSTLRVYHDPLLKLSGGSNILVQTGIALSFGTEENETLPLF